MLFQPTNIIPSTLSGEGKGTIDVNQALKVSWQVNGNSPMVAYRIKFFRNDEESSLVLNMGKVSISTPFFGADEKGNPVPYTVTVSSAQLRNAGMVNGYEKGYKMTIEQWWNNTDSVEQTSASYFITRSEPTVTLATIPYDTDFRKQKHTFEAYYRQEQGDAVSWSRWELQVKENGKWVTVDDTGTVYGAGMTQYTEYVTVNGSTVQRKYYGLSYTYEGFVIGSGSVGVQYRIRCTVQTQNGVQASNGWKVFTTQYIIASGEPLRLCAMRDRNAVRIQMPKNMPVLGQATGSYEYVTGSVTGKLLRLPSGSSVLWGGTGIDSLDIRGPYTLVLKVFLTNLSSSHTCFSADIGGKTLAIAYSASSVAISYNGAVLYNASITLTTSDQLTIVLTEDKAYVSANDGSSVSKQSGDISAWQKEPMESLTISGPGDFYYIWVQSGTLSDTRIEGLLDTQGNIASMDAQTQFIAYFENTLYTGGMYIDSDITMFGIYRKAASSPIFKFIKTIPLNATTKNIVIYDYGANSLETYEYYLLNLTEEYNAPTRNGISSVRPCFWDYSVVCCSYDSTNNYYVVEDEYRFGMNVTSGNVGNNNSPTLQQNFTPYPLRQPVSNNYRSGTLSAFIGRVVDDQYVDTVNLMDALYQLSVDTRPKFLKTRKGQIFRIETASPVAMQITDKYIQQPVKISLPWVEVGDAKESNILAGTL